MPYREFIQRIDRGDPITADYLNTVARAAGLNVSGANGFAGPEGFWLRDRKDIAGRLFKNTGEDTIPAYGIIRITGQATGVGNAKILAGAKPNIYGSQYLHFVNGPKDIASGKVGRCFDDDIATALYDDADGTPAAGELWGPRASTYALKKNTGGWMVLWNVDSTANTVLVRRTPFTWFRGTADADIAKTATGTVSIYYGTGGTYTDTTINMTGCVNEFADITSGSIVEVVWEYDVAGAKWKIVQAECSS